MRQKQRIERLNLTDGSVGPAYSGAPDLVTTDSFGCLAGSLSIPGISSACSPAVRLSSESEFVGRCQSHDIAYTLSVRYVDLCVYVSVILSKVCLRLD